MTTAPVATGESGERVFRRHPEKQRLRWRIEHAQHLDAADIPRFGRLGVIAAGVAIVALWGGNPILTLLGGGLLGISLGTLAAAGASQFVELDDLQALALFPGPVVG